MSIYIPEKIDHQKICKEIIESLQETTKNNFSKNGSKFSKNINVKIFMYDDNTLVQLFTDKERLFSKVPIHGLSSECTIEVIFPDVTCIIAKGKIFFNHT